jgi:putative acyl-CoA dehydrogenase
MTCGSIDVRRLVLNQSTELTDIDLFTGDVALQDAVRIAGVDANVAGLSDFGRAWGSGETADLARLANENPPSLRTVDRRGNRIDVVEFHPAYHALMQRSMADGLHCSTWDDASPSNKSHALRAARLFMAYGAESGHICPITMTHASVAALGAAPHVLQDWLPCIRGRAYDGAHKPWWEKSSVTLGMGMTERQGGTDVRANMTEARKTGDHYEITGHKWFMSAPMCDGFLVLAQATGGLTCFLMPRFRPDGGLNSLHFQRLKDKLGNRSNASSEVEFESAYAQAVGEEGAGIRTIIEMVQFTRLDCAVASAGLMRMGLAQAVHHARQRTVFQKKLIDQPLMHAVLANMALESEAMMALVFRLARAFDTARASPEEAAYARLLTPAIKYLVCKTAPDFLYECMECLGGNGYVEEGPLARAYREAPVNAIWEGSGNVMALDVLRAVARQPEEAMAVIEKLGTAAGLDAMAATLQAALRRHGAEARGRALTEQLARLAAVAALMESSPPLAESYAATRLRTSHSTWGASDPGATGTLLIERVLAAQ